MYLDQSSFCNEDTLEAGEHSETASLPGEFFFFSYASFGLHVEERLTAKHTDDYYYYCNHKYNVC